MEKLIIERLVKELTLQQEKFCWLSPLQEWKQQSHSNKSLTLIEKAAFLQTTAAFFLSLAPHFYQRQHICENNPS